MLKEISAEERVLFVGFSGVGIMIGVEIMIGVGEMCNGLKGLKAVSAF